MKETTKANKRRFSENWRWKEMFKGNGIDIGCGDDPLPGAVAFDKKQGDAQHLLNYFAAETFDFVYSSHCLEHMRDPTVAFREWIEVLKSGGWAVIVVPDFVLYEQLHWPSIYNSDHKSTWSMSLKGSPAPIHCFLPDWLFPFDVRIWRCELVDTNYRYDLLGRAEQTMGEAEAGIEFVVQKASIT